jgi:glycosyltransferase involved in cell wall biosynthesis
MATAQSVLVLSRSYKSSWKSCQSIVENILSFAYPECRRLNYDEALSPESIVALAEKIRSLAPEIIVFSDHLPHPVYLIQALKIVYQDLLMPRLVFYIYGDFSVQSREWIALGKLIQGSPAKFLVASEKHKRFFCQFLLENCGCHRVPFPLNPELFHFSSERRNQIRQQLGWSDDQFVMIYSGRVSLQKNIMALSAVLKLSLAQNPRAKLIFMGPTDDIGAPYFRLRLAKDGYKNVVLNFWRQSPSNISERVTFLTDQPQDKIANYLLAADLFVSLSSYHDEDFGMAPLEAAACGCQLLLSDWAGYSDFIKIPGTLLLPIKEVNEKLGFSQSAILDSLNKVIASNESTSDKEVRSQFVQQEYHSRIKEKTWAALTEEFPKFTGFNEKLAYLNGAFLSGTLADRGFQTYKDLYGVYWNERLF